MRFPRRAPGLRSYASNTHMHEIIKQERNFVAEEMEASILITKTLADAAPMESSPATAEDIATRKPNVVCSNFLGSLIKNGTSQHGIAAKVNARLKLAYQIDNPIQLAIDTIKPLVEYKSMMGRKQTLPKILSPHRQNGVAIRWLISAAKEREYNTVSSLERGLYDEIAAIFAGTSSLYARRFNMHRPS